MLWVREKFQQEKSFQQTDENPQRAEELEYDICSQIFANKSSLDSHMKIHPEEKSFMCDICRQEKPFGCELCGSRFTEKSTLKSHMRIHTGEKPFGCDVCGRKFSNESHLNKHKDPHRAQTLQS
ncbi:hypothetical protein XENORESO_019569 [Xenotaenia resolanae]|uniref:C2H2-type domain-containing protein n=1 Tax=Xenotaenia resolanae TaxID=208358 RepID=A0ABV0WB61_9TELE